MKTTQEYFNMTIDDLLEIRNEYTREECRLFDDGEEVIFFDNENEFAEEKEDFKKYLNSKNFEIKETLKTINERIAVILI